MVRLIVHVVDTTSTQQEISISAKNLNGIKNISIAQLLFLFTTIKSHVNPSIAPWVTDLQYIYAGELFLYTLSGFQGTHEKI